MKILVIGGTGFIGPPLVEYLRHAGHEVCVFHRGLAPRPLSDGVQSILGDRHKLGRYKNEFRRFDPEIVIDLILSSGAHAAELMETVRGIARRVVVASSMDVYRACGVLHGSEAGDLEPVPLTEESPLREQPQTYPPSTLKVLQSIFSWLDDAYDKVAVERTVFSDEELPATALRLPFIHGPADKKHRLYPLLKRMDDGRQHILFSEDMAAWHAPRGYVENVAAAIALAATSERAVGRVYNVCEEPPLSELKWAEKVAAQAGWHGQFVVLPRERAPKHLRPTGNLAQHWAASSRRIRDELGYRERVSMPEALRRTIAWERAHPPQAVSSEQFDYAAEDEALVA